MPVWVLIVKLQLAIQIDCFIEHQLSECSIVDVERIGQSYCTCQDMFLFPVLSLSILLCVQIMVAY